MFRRSVAGNTVDKVLVYIDDALLFNTTAAQQSPVLKEFIGPCNFTTLIGSRKFTFPEWYLWYHKASANWYCLWLAANCNYLFESDIDNKKEIFLISTLGILLETVSLFCIKKEMDDDAVLLDIQTDTFFIHFAQVKERVLMSNSSKSKTTKQVFEPLDK